MTNDIIELAKEAGFKFRSHEEGAGIWFRDTQGNRWFVHIWPQLTKFAELIQARAWQPIETAPRDGTHVILSNGHDLPATCHWFDGGWHLSMNRYGPFSEWTWRTPTHWQPVPLQPTAQKGSV